MDPVGLAALIVALIALTGFTITGASRWWLRRRPLRIEISPSARREDALFVTVKSVGREGLVLADVHANAFDGKSWAIPRTIPPVHRLPIVPGDGAIFLVGRESMPVAGVRWRSLTVLDMEGHSVTGKIPKRYADHLTRA
jgi:hypothetical protein